MYVHQDHLTGTSVMSDGNGALVSSITYTPFGSTRSGSVPTDMKFTGQRLDGTRLYYYGARYYDPQIGRFISPDSIVPDFTNPQAFNRYSYVVNNPLKYIDPTGHDVFDLQDIMATEEAGMPVSAEVYEWALRWEEFSQLEPGIAEIIKNSPLWFVFEWGDASGNLAETNKPNGGVVKITFDEGKIRPDREGTNGVLWAMAHESIHAAGVEVARRAGLEPSTPSKYEEAIALQFQHSFGEKIGYSPTTSSMRRAEDAVDKAMNVDLSQGPVRRYDELEQHLSKAFKDTTYQSQGYPNYPPSQYWSILGYLYMFY